MVEHLKQKAALVTGAAGGMGTEIVMGLLNIPAIGTIFALDIDPVVIGKFSQYPNVISLQADVRSRKQIDEAFERIASQPQKLGYVINGAGEIYAGRRRSGGAGHTKEEARQRRSLWQTNYWAPLYVMDKAEEMMEQSDGGMIIDIASSKGYFPDPYRWDYMESKLALEAASLGRGRRLKHKGIEHFVIEPGNIRTNIDRGTWMSGSSMKEAVAVQGLNEWWRKHFSSHPKKVADAISKIVLGEIKQDVVRIGLDAHLGYFLSKTIPFWRQMFYAGAYTVYEATKMAAKLGGKNRHNSEGVRVNYGSDQSRQPWFRELVDRYMEYHSVLIEEDGVEYYFLIDLPPFINLVEDTGISVEDIIGYRNGKAREFQEKTRLLMSCESPADGDLQYRYITGKDPNTGSVNSSEIILFRDTEVYQSNAIFMPVEQYLQDYS